MYIYTYWSHDSHRDRTIKYLNFESNVEVYFYLTLHPPMPASDWAPSPHSCGRLLWMTPCCNIKLVKFYIMINYKPYIFLKMLAIHLVMVIASIFDANERFLRALDNPIFAHC